MSLIWMNPKRYRYRFNGLNVRYPTYIFTRYFLLHQAFIFLSVIFTLKTLFNRHGRPQI